MGVLLPGILGGNYGSCSCSKSSKQGVLVDVSFLLGFWHLGVQNVGVGGLRFGLGLDRLRVLVPLVAWVQVGSGVVCFEVLAAILLCPGPHTGGELLRKLRGFSSQFWGFRSELMVWTGCPGASWWSS